MSTPIPVTILAAIKTRLETITTENGYYTTVGTVRIGATAAEPQPTDTFPLLNLFSVNDAIIADNTYRYQRIWALEAMAETETDLDYLVDDVRRALLQLPGQRWMTDNFDYEDPEIGAVVFEPRLPGSHYAWFTMTISLLYNLSTE